MSGFSASVNGFQVVGGSLLVPLIGAWSADLSLASDAPLAGPVSVVIGNLTLAGFVIRSAPYGGQTRVRLVGGRGGWRRVIPGQGYGGGGVSLAHVLGDAAAACGEQIVAPPGPTLPAFVRLDGPASDVLWQCLGQGLIPAWYVAPSGITQATAWPATTIVTPFTVTDQRPDEGRITIASEDYAAWMPGCSFTNPLLSGTFTSAGVVYTFDNEGTFRFEVLTGTTDRLLGPLRAFIAAQLAPTRFYGRYAYTIVDATTATVDCTPVNPMAGLPSLRDVPLVGDSIASYLPAPGSTCRIMFVDGVPTQPECVWTSGPPVTVAIGEAPEPLALAAPSIAATAVIAGALATVGAGLVASPSPPYVNFTTFAKVAGPILTGIAAALAVPTALIPTTTVTAGP